MTFDGKAFGAEIVSAVKAHINEVVTPLLARIEELEKAQPITGKDGQRGADGASVSLDDVLPAVQEQVKDFLAAIPLPENGKDGRDGLDVKDLFRAEGGHLIAVMSNGDVKDLGEFVGRDGVPGANGIDGAPGMDGADGVGFDDMDIVETDAGLVLRFTRGDQVKEFPLPVVIDRGVFKEGQIYAKGAGVTWAGSFWIAQEETADKPEASKAWRLAVKRGRDGKDGIVRTINDKPIVKVG